MARIVNQPPRRRDAAASDESGRSGSAWRVFVLGAVVIVVVVVSLLLALRSFLFPVFEANSETARSAATAQAQLAAMQTQQALAPGPTAASTAAPTAQPTAAPTQAPTPAPAAQPAPVATRAPLATAVSTPVLATVNGTPASLPTVSPELDRVISEAYLRYFQVRSEALLALDPEPLEKVAAGNELAALKIDIESDRAQGRALATDVQHQFNVVTVVGDSAVVADRYRDSSIYVDPITHTALPGQRQPSAPDMAPEVKVLYQLQLIDGTWKVVDGERVP